MGTRQPIPEPAVLTLFDLGSSGADAGCRCASGQPRASSGVRGCFLCTEEVDRFCLTSYPDMKCGNFMDSGLQHQNMRMVLTKDGQLLEKTFILVNQLSPEYRLRLVQHILQTLIQMPRPEPSQPLRYGQFQGANLSTPEDFVLAEWRPTIEDLDGT